MNWESKYHRWYPYLSSKKVYGRFCCHFGKITDELSDQKAVWLLDECVCLSSYNRVLFVAPPACNGYDGQACYEENLEQVVLVYSRFNLHNSILFKKHELLFSLCCTGHL